MNQLWRLDREWLAAYSEDPHVWESIRRYRDDFELMAEYYRDGRLFARQWRVPTSRKRVARRLLKCDVETA
ncbi:hypothetical protein GCM10025857_31770 [Alicyclobacillus contaminans]|nr:hypothetical protein GCM10025857_31770 [Alicyclobacillus contaminans]